MKDRPANQEFIPKLCDFVENRPELSIVVGGLGGAALAGYIADTNLPLSLLVWAGAVISTTKGMVDYIKRDRDERN